MAIALIVLLLLSTILGVLAVGVQNQNRDLIRESRRVRADALSDAVLAETLAGLAKSPSFTGVAGHELAGGFVESRVRRDGRLATVDVTVELGPVRRHAHAQVELVERRPRVLAWSSSGAAAEGPNRDITDRDSTDRDSTNSKR